MARRHLTAILTALWVVVPLSAQAGEAQSVKPLVLILLDTSGSMEYEPSCEYCVPACEDAGKTTPKLFSLGNYPKSRLTLAKEMLTGAYQDYWCRADGDIPVPHSEACAGMGSKACSEPQQAFDGLLDIYRDRVKFALMTFDNVENPAQAAPGGWSYPKGATKGINLGARNARWAQNQPFKPNVFDETLGVWTFDDDDRKNPNRGQLIPPADSDDYGPMIDTNRKIQYEVNSVYGDGGTPLGALLDDAKYFLENDSSVAGFDSNTGTGDPYSGCRDRIVLLITDGQNTMGDGAYPSTADAIKNLQNASGPKVSVYVVGMSLDAASEAAISTLPADGVFLVSKDNPGKLVEALSQVLGDTLSDVQSYTEVTYSNDTRSEQDLQYQFDAGYQTDEDNGLNLNGFLNQTIYRCAGACAAVSDGGLSCARDQVPIHDLLNKGDNSKRDLRAVVNGTIFEIKPKLANEAGSREDMAKFFGVPQSGNLPQINPDGFGAAGPILSSNTLGSSDDLSNQQEYMRQLLGLIRSDDESWRKKKRLGAITHATPTVQERARAGFAPMESWEVYLETPVAGGQFSVAPQCRPTVLYTGTHDGLIHAFRVDALDTNSGECAGVIPLQDDKDVGEELWAIIPQRLLKSAHALVDRQPHLMDGQIRVSDVLLTRTDPLGKNAAAEAKQWRSVLTAGYGIGGRGYISLDVTNALDGPNLLWEIDHQSRCVKDKCTQGAFNKDSDFSRLGLTTGRPAYGTASIDGAEVAIAVLSGGASPDDASTPEAGRAVYVVRLDDGSKIAEFSNDHGSVVTLSGNSTHIVHPITGTPVVFSDTPGVVSTRAFVGDAGGRMWRLDMSAANPDDWKLQLFHDMYSTGPLATSDDNARVGVLGTPAISLANTTGHLAVVFGTGSLDFVSDGAATRSGVVSLSEVTSAAGTVSAQVNWTEVLDSNEKLTGAPIVFAGTSYFGAFASKIGDACSTGTGRLYGVHFTDTGSDGQTKPGLDADGDPSTLDLVTSVDLGDAIPTGIQVVQRPGCQVGGAGGGGGGGGSATQGDLDLVVNVSKGSGFSAKTVPPGVNGGQAKTKTLTQQLSTSGEMLQSSSWGYVLY